MRGGTWQVGGQTTQQGQAQRAECLQFDAACRIARVLQADVQVGTRQQGAGLLRPLDEFQAGAGKQVAQAGVFPFLRVPEAVKITVPGGKAWDCVALDQRIAGAFDSALYAQRLQQVAHQGRFAGAEFAFQRQQRMRQRGLARQRTRKVLRCREVGPMHVQRCLQAFYNGSVTFNSAQFDGIQLVSQIQVLGQELGFSQIGVSPVDLSAAEVDFMHWLSLGFHGSMDYMQRHGVRRTRPAELVPGTVSVLTARMDYLPRAAAAPGDDPDWRAVEWQRLHRADAATVSVYARGRDYHKVLRARLQTLAHGLQALIGPFGYRVFTDSAPVLEVALAERSGLGWRGKHTLLLNREAGSLFFLGEIFVDVALPLTPAQSSHCGSCSACLDVCPTQAIVAPYLLDARRCISYLTIEHAGPIPEALRAPMGNRIYGCDDCQLVCPWNKYAQRSPLPDFDARAVLLDATLPLLFGWTEAEFLHHTEGSAIRRIGHARWLRNVAVALGNALAELPPGDARDACLHALQRRREDANEMLREHVHWALQQMPQPCSASASSAASGASALVSGTPGLA